MAQQSFAGKIGRRIAESTPGWPPKQAQRRPNVLLVLFDDVGFADLGCYGSTISTPTIDALAARGLRYTGFHTTAMCSTTRAALLTGRRWACFGGHQGVDSAMLRPILPAKLCWAMLASGWRARNRRKPMLRAQRRAHFHLRDN